ncbi:MAG TPA: GAF domain-containing protein [Anaerolineae bacterium]|nr:GAF domain-containing protein [Anaerolineae bacterium]HMR62612.1 GAF domain-containing protein [Anaerolineae bacterium]
MVDKLKRFFSPPIFEAEDKSYRARVLNIILLILIPLSVLAAANSLLIINNQGLFVAVLITGAFFLLARLLLHFRYLILASLLVPAILLVMFTFITYSTHGIHSVELLGFAMVISLAGLLLGRRWPVIFAVASFLALGWVTYAEVNGLIETPFSDLANYGEWLNIAPMLLILGFTSQITISNLTHSLQQARLNEQALSQSNRQLKVIQISLEAQTAGLATVAALGERLNTLLNLEAMLPELADRVKDPLGYSEVQVYLLNQTTQALIPQIETRGQAESIPLSRTESLVAQAARSRQVLTSAPEADTAFGAEIAAPIMLEQQVLGILYGRANSGTLMDQGAINIWRSLTNQLAVAINNAHRFAETERALAEARVLQEQYIQQNWQTRAEREQEYSYQRQGEPELPAPVIAQLKQLAQHQPQATPVSLESSEAGDDFTAVVAPIKLQDQVIGAMEFHELNPTRRWSEQELALIQTVSDQIAQTAENLRLFNETQERASRERLIGQIGDKLRRAPDLETLVKIGIQEVSKALGTKRAYVRLGLDTEAEPPAAEIHPSTNGHTLEAKPVSAPVEERSSQS